jgi:ABC-2 type transport system ATP-binding protein
VTISISNLRKSYAGQQAVAGLSLDVAPGEILGFLGPNGAGKSTTVKILTGLLTPDAGTASICGFDVVEQPLETKRRFGYIPEAPVMYETLTAAEYLDLMGSLYHLDARTRESRATELLELFGIGGERNKRLKEFSKGMKQKVVISSALIHRPDVLILDEPFDGLDANTAMVVKELLRRFAEQGKAVLFCSHILEVVERMCTRIVVIDKGRLVAEGTSQQICERTGTHSLDEAFARLTGVRDPGQVTADFLSALERA